MVGAARVQSEVREGEEGSLLRKVTPFFLTEQVCVYFVGFVLPLLTFVWSVECAVVLFRDFLQGHGWARCDLIGFRKDRVVVELWCMQKTAHAKSNYRFSGGVEVVLSSFKFRVLHAVGKCFLKKYTRTTTSCPNYQWRFKVLKRGLDIA